jgi:capsular exopolysaccharide synthesis family protein
VRSSHSEHGARPGETQVGLYGFGVLDTSGGGGDELREQVGVLWRRKWWIVAALVVTVGVALGRLALQTPEYRATTNLLLATSSSVDPVTGQPVVANAKQAQNEADLAASSVVAAVAQQQLGFPAEVTATAAPTSDRLAISAVSDDPEEAAEVANAFAAAYVEVRRNQSIDGYRSSVEALQPQIDELEGQIAELDDELVDAEPEQREALSADRERLADQLATYSEILDRLSAAGSLAAISRPQVIDPALPPADPFEPQVEQTLALALAAGLVLGIALAYLVEYLDDTVRDPHQLERFTSVPVLASIPGPTRRRSRTTPVELFIDQRSGEAATEAMRSLRTAIQFYAADHQVRSIVITSPNAAEGKTTTLANLAVAFNEASQRIAIFSTDLRRPVVHDFFGLQQAPGLTDVVLSQALVSDVARRLQRFPQLVVVPSGPVPPNPVEILNTSTAMKTFDAMEQTAQLVMFDSPPVLPVADALVLAARADAVIVVVAYRRTRRGQLRAALEALSNVDATVLGLVITGGPTPTNYGYAYGSQYSTGIDTGSDHEG